MVLAVFIFAFILLGLVWDTEAGIHADYYNETFYIKIKLHYFYKLFTLKKEWIISVYQLKKLTANLNFGNGMKMDMKCFALKQITIIAHMGFSEDSCLNLISSGILQILSDNILPFICKSRVSIRPVMQGESTRIKLEGITLVHTRKIIADAVRYAVNKAKGERFNHASD